LLQHHPRITPLLPRRVHYALDYRYDGFMCEAGSWRPFVGRWQWCLPRTRVWCAAILHAVTTKEHY
jgi:hypothetical protein